MPGPIVSGVIGRQYESEESRAEEIDAGAARPARIIRADLREALAGCLTAIREHPAHLWDAPGEWLGGGRRPVSGVVRSLRREVEYHHVDLDAGYGPANWPDEFVRKELERVTEAMTDRKDAPDVTVIAPEALRVEAAVTVTGQAADLLGWLTGRASGRRLQVAPPGSLPVLPPLA